MRREAATMTFTEGLDLFRPSVQLRVGSWNKEEARTRDIVEGRLEGSTVLILDHQEAGVLINEHTHWSRRDKVGDWIEQQADNGVL